MGTSSAEFEAAAIVLDRQHPATGLARQTHQSVLRSAVAAYVGEGLAHNSRDLAAGCGRQIDLGRVAHELRPNSGVLPIARNHSREEIDEMPRVKFQRLQ